MINDWYDFAAGPSDWDAADFSTMGHEWRGSGPSWFELLTQLIMDVSVPLIEHVLTPRTAEGALPNDREHLIREYSAQLQDHRDTQLTIDVAEDVGKIGQLTPEIWSAAPIDQRAQALAKAAQVVGGYFDSPVLFTVGDVQVGSIGECQPLAEGFRVSIARDLLTLDHPRDAVRTLLHELRHVQQHEIVRLGQLTNLDPAQVDVTTTERWAEEFAAYSTDSYVYKNLGIEADAELFAVRVTDAVYRN